MARGKDASETVLVRRSREVAARREALRHEVRERLRKVCRAILPPGERYVVFGSLTRPRAFREGSDVDLAIWRVPSGMTLYGLTARMEEAVGRRVDVVLLGESRLRDRILEVWESWTNSDS